MKLSTKGRYGVRMMLELALHYGQGPVLLKDIAQQQEVSEKYLWHLVGPLKTAGLINSLRGAKGGYVLTKSSSQIKLIQIIKALEGSLAPVECVDDPRVCKRISICVTRDVWKRLKDAIEEILGAITLEDLVKSHKRKNRQETKMYYI